MPAHQGIGYSELLRPGQEPCPGIRSQIAVVDYDGDGKLDILLGDFCTYLHVKKDLTAEQRGAFEAARSRQNTVVKSLRDSMDALRERWKVMMKDVPKSERSTPENSAKWQKMYQEMRESPEYKKCNAEYEQTRKEITKYVDAATRGVDAPAAAHGYVWLFRRK